ncbi:hypothetical protein PMAYCL1PPCAC_26397, partial [Pristionchus mayeri]
LVARSYSRCFESIHFAVVPNGNLSEIPEFCWFPSKICISEFLRKRCGCINSDSHNAREDDAVRNDMIVLKSTRELQDSSDHEHALVDDGMRRGREHLRFRTGEGTKASLQCF